MKKLLITSAIILTLLIIIPLALTFKYGCEYWYGDNSRHKTLTECMDNNLSCQCQQPFWIDLLLGLQGTLVLLILDGTIILAIYLLYKEIKKSNNNE